MTMLPSLPGTCWCTMCSWMVGSQTNFESRPCKASTYLKGTHTCYVQVFIYHLKHSDAVSYRVYGRQARAMGATLRGCKNFLAKIETFTYSFFNLYFAPHTTVNCKTASTSRARIYSNVWSRACCVSKHYDKTAVNTTVRHCDRTRRLACHIYNMVPLPVFSTRSSVFAFHLAF